MIYIIFGLAISLVSYLGYFHNWFWEMFGIIVGAFLIIKGIEKAGFRKKR